MPSSHSPSTPSYGDHHSSTGGDDHNG
jgi:hypothetical protein